MTEICRCGREIDDDLGCERCNQIMMDAINDSKEESEDVTGDGDRLQDWVK